LLDLGPVDPALIAAIVEGVADDRLEERGSEVLSSVEQAVAAVAAGEATVPQPQPIRLAA
jgi:hypothetical protein